MLACQGRDMVQWSPLGWARQWVLIHDETLTIALASKEDAAKQASLCVAKSTSLCCYTASQVSIIHLVAQLSKYYLLLLHN